MRILSFLVTLMVILVWNIVALNLYMYGFGQKNEVWTTIIEFASAYNLCISNTFFQKNEEYLITFKSESSKSQIDFFMRKKNDCVFCKYCNVIPGEPIMTQHKLLTLDILLKVLKNHKVSRGESMIMWWKFKGESLLEFQAKMIEKGPWKINGDSEEMRNTMTSCIRNVGKDILGKTKGGWGI